MSDAKRYDVDQCGVFHERANGSVVLAHDYDELRARADALAADLAAARDHLAGIEKLASNSRTQTHRLQLIAARCRSALNGDDEWTKLTRPRKRHPLATPENTGGVP